MQPQTKITSPNLLNHIPYLAILSIFFLFAGCSEEKPPFPEKKIQPVTITTASKSPRNNTRTFSGKAENSRTTTLSFRVGGNIENLPVKVGSRIHKGDIVARLDPRDFKLRVQKAEASLKSARSKYREIAQDFKRMRRLRSRDVISQSKFEEVKSAYQSATANLEEAKKVLGIARRNLSFTTLRAPQTGTISKLQVEKFQNVGKGQAVATLICGNQTEVVVGVPDKLIYSLRPGKKAKVTFNALPDRTFKGRVNEISMQPSPISTYPVTVVIDNPSPDIRPGMAALISFDFPGKSEPSIFLPLSCVVREPYGNKFVWTVDPETSRVHKKEVGTGTVRRNSIQITSGVHPGEEIVLRGIHRLQSGQEVKALPRDRF